VASSAAVGAQDQPTGLAKGEKMNSLLIFALSSQSGVFFHIRRAQEGELEGRREKEESDYISSS
jgi:hypothetical protein